MHGASWLYSVNDATELYSIGHSILYAYVHYTLSLPIFSVLFPPVPSMIHVEQTQHTTLQAERSEL